MKRIQLFEFEDLGWFPDTLRNSMTNLIVVLHKMMGIPSLLADLIENALKISGEENIVDLGSGSGGAMPEVAKILAFKGIATDILLTDRYPNPQAIQTFKNLNNSTIKYYEKPVDATHLEKAPAGLKVMSNSFHHMRPEQAKAILKSAQENKQTIVIYEMAENSIPTILWWLFLPISLTIVMLMCLVMTPLVRPLSWQQLVFTYLIPIIPICYAWDGQASLPRMYSMKDIDSMLAEMPNDAYTWEKGAKRDRKGKKRGTYLMGTPKRS